MIQLPTGKHEMEVAIGSKVVVLISQAETIHGTVVDLDASGQVTVAQVDGSEWVGDESMIDDVWDINE